MKTHYELLGLESSATPDDIKHAFRREIARYHPDKVQHLGHEFQEIAAVRAAELTEAYRILMDPSAREKYDAALGNGTTAVSPPAERGQSEEADAHQVVTPVPESLKQTRATLNEFVRKATLARIVDATEAACDASATSVRGFDGAFLCKARGGLFKKAEPPLLVLIRLVAAVDPPAIEEVWPFALKAVAGQAAVCMMLVGQGMAPAKDLAAAIADLRRKSRSPGPIIVPIDFRDWDALFPPETPSAARSIVERLRQGDR